MTINEFEDALREAIEEISDEANVRAFRDTSLLTRDRGFVVRFGKDEFQVTLVRSKGERDGDMEDSDR